jgi:hypothetical protein
MLLTPPGRAELIRVQLRRVPDQAGQVTVEAVAVVQIAGAQQDRAAQYVRPCHHSSITLSDTGGLKRTRALPPICTHVLIDWQVGEGVPKDRYERELFMNTPRPGARLWLRICGCGTQMADHRISV